MLEVADLDAAVQHISDIDDSGRLPFDWYEIGPVDGQLRLAVSRLDEAAAIMYFRRLELTLHDGTPIVVTIEVRAGMSWTSEPLRGAPPKPHPSALDGLPGVDVNEAALRANAAGWVVRAHERQAILTADFRPDRANLLFDDDGGVREVHIG